MVYLKLLERKDDKEKRANWEQYKTSKKKAKLVVMSAKTIELHKKLYKLAKVQERKSRDLDQVNFIKDEEDKVMMKGAHIIRRWQAYFHKLLNEEGNNTIVLLDLDQAESRQDFRYYRHIKVDEVEGAMRKMRRGRATGPDKIQVKFEKARA
ncbi:uncharacterized protein LOC142172531 [Nicotiana tabacum]|uniref:Uncharacterized protein LOC142172531 n=1 Tax=Nicotiana tabacum TaxID=4097 RepID=A0AC58T525_TOBAC